MNRMFAIFFIFASAVSFATTDNHPNEVLIKISYLNLKNGILIRKSNSRDLN
jgi:hypothetical protein